MRDELRGVVSGTVADCLRSWRSLAQTDIVYKLLAFALLSPATALLLSWLRSGASSRVVADADILRFLVTTPAGAATLVLGGSLLLAITALEAAALMAIGLTATRGTDLSARGALAFAARRAPNVLRLTANMVVRILAGLLPFLLGGGLVYALLLRQHDINYYLTERPPTFWLAVALVASIAIALAALLVRTTARWALALPLVLFEGVSPRRALGESARRSIGDRRLIAMLLAGWGLFALALTTATASIPEIIGRGVAPHCSSLGLLLLVIAGLALLWLVLGLVAGIVNFSLFSLLIVRIYLQVGEPGEPRLPVPASTEHQSGGARRLSGSARAGVGAVVLLGAIGLALLAFLATRSNQPVLVIAHRGSAAVAPENTLAAFRLAVEQGADFFELDVQESADGEVVVVHDSDLMKVGGVPMKIWQTDAAQIRTVDVGSHAGAQFTGERVPTLAEALAVARGRARVIVELKSYGQAERLEERVAAVVEAAGMENDCIYMSLDHDMVRKMKRLRPAWRSGVLAAKAYGDLRALGADFLAVEAGMATPRFVRRAHRADQDVYVWTVNDPAGMLGAMSRGVDGLITDRPDVARAVVEQRAGMSDAQRLLVALMVRLGARTETLAAGEAPRP